MSYYDEQFTPWQIVDGKCVVADEAEWKKLKSLERIFSACPCCKHMDATPDVDCGIRTYVCHDCRSETPQSEWHRRPIFKVSTDIFEDVEGPFVANEGRLMVNPDGDWMLRDMASNRLPHGSSWLTMSDLLTRTLRTIDSPPHVDYLIMTQRPELVRGKWLKCFRCNGNGRVEMLEHCPVCGGIGDVPNRKNVILSTYVETQNDIDRLTPGLLKCHDLCKGLAVVCNPKEELDFTNLDNRHGETFNALTAEVCQPWHNNIFRASDRRPMDLVIAEGNDHPIQPDHLRSLRDQCKDAEVPFHFSSWGRFIPSSCVPPCPDTGHYLWPWKDQGDETMMLAIDAERSCRLLDGQEHSGRLTND